MLCRALKIGAIGLAEQNNHDEFRKLLEGHVAAGIFTVKTHWHDYCLNALFDSIMCEINAKKSW